MVATYLDKFTKEELISWIHQNCYSKQPKESDLLLIRWQNEIKKNRKRDEELSKFLESIDFAERDKLAEKFNQSKDIKEKLLLAEKMQPYHDKWKQYLKKSEANHKDYQRIQKIYGSIDKARENEKP